MQISTIASINPNRCLGFWVEHSAYPEAGAGQIQSAAPDCQAYFIEHFQKPVVGHQSLNGVLHKQSHLVLARFLYLGYCLGHLYYAHKQEIRKMPWKATGSMPLPGTFEEAPFSEQKHYLIRRHYDGQGEPLSDQDQTRVIRHWQRTGELERLIPYLIPYQGIERISVTEYLKQLKTTPSIITL